ncbi:MAG TPA: NAD(P)-dependent oxidoreductase [Clostridiaceae bacterium]
MSRKLLITGGTGFIGINLVNYLNNENYIINIGRNKNPLCHNIFWNLHDNLESLSLKDVDTIIHCASIVGDDNTNKSQYIDVNVKSTLELLEFSLRNKIKKFILISTGGVYGFSKKVFEEGDICNATGIYSLSKYFSEKVCELYKDKLSVVILRLFFPYGNGQKGRLISNLFNNIIEENKSILSKNGQPIINPVHIIDVVSIIKGVIENNLEGTFNICGNEYLSIAQICKKISFVENIEDVEFIFGDKDIDNLMGNNNKICRSLNYTMKVDIDLGLQLFSNYLKNKGGI